MRTKEKIYQKRCLTILILSCSMVWSVLAATAHSAEADNSVSHLKAVEFKIIDEITGEPLKNRELNICYPIRLRARPGAPSPYLNQNSSIYITSVQTDTDGLFTLDMTAIKAVRFVVEPNSPYRAIEIGRSCDLARTKSANHIRVFEGYLGGARVNGNLIYDLKRKVVKVIESYSGKVEEKPYEHIILAVKRKKDFLPGEKSSVGTGEKVIDSNHFYPERFKARSVRFPVDSSIGMLTICKWDPKSRWPDEDLAEARGKVGIPAGYMLGLKFTKGVSVDLSGLADLKPNDLQSLHLYRTKVVNADLRHISRLTGLEQLGLGITDISYEGLGYLSNLKNLKELNLSRTKITDGGVAHLRGLINLEILLIANTSITDASVDYLKELKSLKYLRIRNTKITADGITALKEALPECSIDHDVITNYESDWGLAVKGLQCRLRSERLVWEANDVPELALDIRNVGDEDIMCAPIVQFCEIEYDGVWYEWAGNKYAEILSFPLKPGRKNIKLICLKIPSRKVWVSKEIGNSIELKEGKHVVRVRYRPNPYINEMSIISSPFEIEILPPKLKPTAKAAG